MNYTAEEVERRLLGACLLHPPTLAKVAAEIVPEEFTHPLHRACYDAMRATADDGHEFDAATLQARMVAAGVDSVRAAETLNYALSAETHTWAVGEYVALLHTEAGWHRSTQAGTWLIAAGDQRDDELREQAVSLLTQRPGGGWRSDIDSLYDDVIERLEGKRGTYLPTPFQRLNHALGGGLVPGEVTVVGGWTSHAKSVLVMQTADDIADNGGDCHYLTNEMRRDEVALRIMAGHDGPPFPTLRAGQVSQQQWGRVVKAMNQVALKVVDAHTRTCEEICAYVVSRKPDLAVLDLFNRLPRQGGLGTRELDEQVNRICDAAARANSHVLLVSQLNRARLSQSKEYPHPTLGDLRDTGALGTHPANVLFTYLTNDEGVRDGYVEVAKARNGEVGVSVDVTLNPNRMRLLQTTLV